MKLRDAIPKLGELLESAKLRVTFDANANITKPCFYCGTEDTPRALVVVGAWTRPMGHLGDVGSPIRRPMCLSCTRGTEPESQNSLPADDEPLKTTIVRSLAEKDPAYCPYCLNCQGLVRMKLVEPFLWKCTCGASHDERRPTAGVFTY